MYYEQKVQSTLMEQLDIHEYLHGPSTIPSTTHPITGEKIPVTLGHEFSGTIIEVGEGVTRLQVGDNVAIKPNLFDGGCAACLGGWVNCCDNLGFVGLVVSLSLFFLTFVLVGGGVYLRVWLTVQQVVLVDYQIMLLSRRIGL